MIYQRDGLSLAYDDVGSGLPVILIHGFPLNRQMWRPQAKAIAAAGFRVITPDLRGFGESEAGTGTISMNTFADDVVALMEWLDLQQAVIGGMSMGGYVLLNLLARHPGRIIAPIFIVTRSGDDDEAGKAKRSAMIDEVKKFGPRIAASIFTQVLFAEETAKSSPELIEHVARWMEKANTAGLAGGLIAMRDRADSTPLLSRIDKPALVIGASDDRAMGREHFQILIEGLPRATWRMIDGAGHMVNMEKTDEFNDCLLAFLDGLKSAGQCRC